MLKNKKGFTIIESVIAMMLVAVIVGGVFAALMASRRAIIEPSYKEDMIYAVETLNNVLKMHISGATPAALTDGAGTVGPCGASPLTNGSHSATASCVTMPEVCGDGSSFTYAPADYIVTDDIANTNTFTLKRVEFYIDCRRDVL